MNRLLSPIVLAATAAVVLLLWGWLRLAHSAVAVESAQQQLAAQMRDLQRLVDLRATVAAPVSGRRQQDDLVSRAQQALSSAGLPISACSGVQPRADQTANGWRIQTVQLRLQGLRPGDFRAWLDAWNTPSQPWRLSELQMTHAANPAATGASSLDANRYDLVLVFTAPYLEEGT
jgi:hypothetical protein